MENRKGTVSFVSSGPGDPELMTLRAIRRLQAADVVLYDDLASGPILELAGPQAECIPVGKRAGRPSARQEQVNALLVEHALAGRHPTRRLPRLYRTAGLSVRHPILRRQAMNTSLIDQYDQMWLTAQPALGIPAAMGTVPVTEGQTDHAASMIGQGRVTASAC